MALLVTPPEIIGFSKDPIIWQFEDDRDGIVPGIPAENLIAVNENITEGTQVVIRWDDKEIRFTATAAPGPYGASFPTYTYNSATHEAYIKSLVPYFRDNYFINEDFVVTAEDYTITGPFGSATIWTLRFNARKAGKKFNFVLTSFPGGVVNNYVAGSDDSDIVNNSVFIEVWLGNEGSDSFERIFKAALQLDADSRATVDVAPLLHSSLTPELPDFLLPVAQRCQDSRRKYYLKYAPAGGENFEIGKLTSTSNHVVLLGGFSERKGGPKSVTGTFKVPVGNADKLLMLQSRTRYVRTDEPVFVSWVNFGAEGRNIFANATVVFADGTSLVTNTNVVTGVMAHEKLMFAVGFSQLNLGYFQGVKTVKEYTVELRDDLGNVSEPYRLIIDYAHQEYVRYFAHVNSYGAIETVKTYGKGSSSWKVFKESAEKVIPYQFNSSESQFVEWNLKFQDSAEVSTGFMRRMELAYFLDFFLSPVKYRIIKGAPYAIAVNTDTIQRGTDGDNLFALVFEYQFQRLFDSLSEEVLEGEDTQDYIPPNVVIASNTAPPQAPPVSGPPALRVAADPYPIQGSDNPVSSNGVYRLMQQYQPKLPQGDATQFITGEGKLKVFSVAVNAAERDPTVPSYAKSLTGIEKILNDLQALTPGLNVNLFGGQNPDWYIKRMTHPAFSELPVVTVTQGEPFVKYLDLKNYQNSYHPIEELTVDVTYNSLKLAGLEVDTDQQLVIKLSGQLDASLSTAENVLIAIRDLYGNQKVISLRIQTIEDDPEIPDNRPVCPWGPFHYPQTPIQVFNNGSFRCPFDAEGVPQLRWKIVNNDTDTDSLRDGMSLNDNGPFFIAEFDPLPGKTYRLGIQGDLCKSQWVFRDLIIPDDSALAWFDGYPKHEVDGSDSEFLLKITVSAQLLTEVLNLTTGIKVYSSTHDYVADLTEISIPKTGGWPDAKYRINAGTLTADITVGTPVEPPSFTFKLVNGWDGTTIKDLATGTYDGQLPAGGFNISFQSNQLGFAYNYLSAKLEYKVAGVWTHVTSAGGAFSVGSGTSSTVLNPFRIFPSAGVDSRFVLWNSATINRFGEFRVTYEFRNGGPSGTVVNTKQQTFKLNELKVFGGWTDEVAPVGENLVPTIARVRLNGVNVVNSNVWAEPFLTWGNTAPNQPDRRIEYSVDGGATWHRTSSWFDGVSGSINDVSRILLLNSGINNFPSGKTAQVILRCGFNPAIRSAPVPIQVGAVVVDPEPGDIVAKVILRTFPEHMFIQVSGTGINKKITDTCTLTPPSGHEFWYFINDQIVKTPTRLVDFPWPSDVPVGIMKAQPKLGLDSLNRWANSDGYYYDPNAAASFSRNSSVAQTVILFEPENTGWDLSKQVVQWMDYIPDMPYDENDPTLWVMPIGQISTLDELSDKGVTHFTNYEILNLPEGEQDDLIAASRTYEEVPKTMSQLNLPDSGGATLYVSPPGQPNAWPTNWNNLIFGAPSPYNEPLTTTQGGEKGNEFPTTHAMNIFENTEQYYAIAAHWPFWKPYYQNLTSRLQAVHGDKWRVAHNYFTGLGGEYPDIPEFYTKRNQYGSTPTTLGYASRAQHKAFISAPLSDYPPSVMLPGGVMEDVNTVCYGLYLNAPDLTVDNAYRMIYAAFFTHKANKFILAFMQSFYEWRPNNLIEVILPGGKAYFYTKLGHNPAQATNYAFLSRVFLDGFVPFSAAAKTDGQFRWHREFHNNNILWYPTGATDPANNDSFPFWTEPGENEAFPGGAFESFIAEGMRKYRNSFYHTRGGTRSFLRFRINGGSWIEPASTYMHDIVDGLFDKRAIVVGEVLGDQLAVMYMNPYADGSIKTLEFKHPGSDTVYSRQVASTIVHEYLIEF